MHADLVQHPPIRIYCCTTAEMQPLSDTGLTLSRRCCCCMPTCSKYARCRSMCASVRPPFVSPYVCAHALLKSRDELICAAKSFHTLLSVKRKCLLGAHTAKDCGGGRAFFTSALDFFSKWLALTVRKAGFTLPAWLIESAGGTPQNRPDFFGFAGAPHRPRGSG